jgi:hypothetical protein
MTPSQFCVWLSGYASAKPDTLDPQVQTELDAIIADMVASKLSNAGAEEDFERMKAEFEARKIKAELDMLRQMQAAKQAIQSGGIVYASNTADKPHLIAKAV